MIGVTVYGRGGQGVVKAAQLLAVAAFLSGYEAQAFPMFGVERRGAPIQSFIRMDRKQIRTRTQIKKADFAIVINSTLINSGINAKEIIVNSKKKFSCCRNFDADAAAAKIFPLAVNTAMVAAFASFTGIITKGSLIKACYEIFESDAARKNAQIIEEIYKTKK